MFLHRWPVQNRNVCLNPWICFFPFDCNVICYGDLYVLVQLYHFSGLCLDGSVSKLLSDRFTTADRKHNTRHPFVLNYMNIPGYIVSRPLSDPSNKQEGGL